MSVQWIKVELYFLFKLVYAKSASLPVVNMELSKWNKHIKHLLNIMPEELSTDAMPFKISHLIFPSHFTF